MLGTTCVYILKSRIAVFNVKWNFICALIQNSEDKYFLWQKVWAVARFLITFCKKFVSCIRRHDGLENITKVLCGDKYYDWISFIKKGFDECKCFRKNREIEIVSNVKDFVLDNDRSIIHKNNTKKYLCDFHQLFILHNITWCVSPYWGFMRSGGTKLLHRIKIQTIIKYFGRK